MEVAILQHTCPNLQRKKQCKCKVGGLAEAASVSYRCCNLASSKELLFEKEQNYFNYVRARWGAIMI